MFGKANPAECLRALRVGSCLRAGLHGRSTNEERRASCVLNSVYSGTAKWRLQAFRTADEIQLWE